MRGDLATWCRVLAVGPPCAHACPDCRARPVPMSSLTLKEHPVYDDLTRPDSDEAASDDQPWWRVAVIREVTKQTITLRLDQAPRTLFHPPLPDRTPIEDTPRLADVVVTTVDGQHWEVHGMTVSGTRGLGRYFRRSAKHGTWADDTPGWVQAVGDAVGRGALAWPTQVCADCGYAVEGHWDVDHVPSFTHAAGWDGDHPVTRVTRDTAAEEVR